MIGLLVKNEAKKYAKIRLAIFLCFDSLFRDILISSFI